MRLLMVTPHPPCPPNSGARIRQSEQLRYLAQRNEVTVVFFRDPDAEDARDARLDGLGCRAVPVSRARRVGPADLALSREAPWPLRWHGSAEMHRALVEVHCDTFDAVIVESLYMTLYRDVLPARAILQEQNIESQLPKQYARLRHGALGSAEDGRDRAFWNATGILMEDYENRTWRRFPLRTTVSEADKAEMDRRCPTGRSIVVENGVNVHTHRLLENAGTRTILFMGTLNYFPNVDAAFYLVKSIMPAIWTIRPDTQLIIAGRKPDPSLAALSSDPRIIITSNPDDMGAVAAHASVSVVPLRTGGGSRLKILESLAWGLPVVSTRLGSKGLEVTDAQDVLIRDEPEPFAQAVLQLLSDQEMWQNVRSKGRQLVERRYAWESGFERLEAEIQRLVAGPTALTGRSE